MWKSRNYERIVSATLRWSDINHKSWPKQNVVPSPRRQAAKKDGEILQQYIADAILGY